SPRVGMASGAADDRERPADDDRPTAGVEWVVVVVSGPVLLPGGDVVIPAAHCAGLVHAIRVAAREGLRVSRDLTADGNAFGAAAAQEARRQASAASATALPRVLHPAEAGPPSTEWSTAVVADRLAVSERRVRQIANAGRLPGRKVRGSWRFDP